jgi:hypothetical protein
MGMFFIGFFSQLIKKMFILCLRLRRHGAGLYGLCLYYVYLYEDEFQNNLFFHVYKLIYNSRLLFLDT